MSDTNETQACVEIHAWVNEVLGNREAKPGAANRASSAPQCVRKRWMANQGIAGEPMQPRSLVVFATGDVVEHVYKYFIAKACVGPGKLYAQVDFGEKSGTFIIQHREFDIHKQETVYTRIAKPDGTELAIPGHADGWGKRNSDGEWESIEIKSAASFGFDDFVAGKCDYLPQSHTIMMSDKALNLGVKSTRYFYMNKNNSQIFDRLYQFDEAIWEKAKQDFLLSNGPTMPAMPEGVEGLGAEPVTKYNRSTKQYDPTGQFKLGWKCGYCEYRANCWPNARLEFSNTNKPIYYVKDESEEAG